MKRNMLKELKLFVMVIAGSICICACGSQPPSVLSDIEEKVSDTPDESSSEATEEVSDAKTPDTDSEELAASEKYFYVVIFFPAIMKDCSASSSAKYLS